METRLKHLYCAQWRRSVARFEVPGHLKRVPRFGRIVLWECQACGQYLSINLIETVLLGDSSVFASLIRFRLES